MLSFQQSQQTFFVEEQLAYEPSGDGEHVFLLIEKWGLSTHALKRRLSEMSGVPLREMRHAGKKDAASTSVQWVSWPKRAQKFDMLSYEGDGFKTLQTTAHEHGLAIGHVKANRFRLLLQGDESCFDGWDLPELRFPNFFGPQRFGSGPSAWSPDMAPGKGYKPNRDQVSVRQAMLFNTFLYNRITADFSVEDDELWMTDGGKRFFQAPFDEEIKNRFLAGEIAPSGPLFGYKVRLRDKERAFLDALGLQAEDFRQWGKAARGGRRPLFVTAKALKLTFSGENIWELNFELPAGVYATVLLLHVFSPRILKSDLDQMPNFTQTVRWQRGSNELAFQLV